ncbi:MAG: 30S ribosomal protein S7 [Pseudomonadota bacterium]|nr:30S ribosomal protein S7 [Gammaproteobacteria bacterium]MBU1558810.1 30S ribosomal protein S7 [Gammaproteobacteria bacterium]MBU1926692.1 30S ribosomal protein S7 [Gammaproteobacteria bacterium]MBU2545926.1 30S ribosomal protein S7 [Gammaproteobacteria bacterium]
MSRRRAAAKRKKLPDPKYRSVIVTKFINHLMLDGKKALSEKIVYSALETSFKLLKDRLLEDGVISKASDDNFDGGNSGTGRSILMMFEKILGILSPTVEVRSRRVGGATYQVPVEVRPDRRITLAMRWLIDASRGRSEKTMVQRLAHEIVDVYQGKGTSLKKKDDTHRMALANQAFVHYQW